MRIMFAVLAFGLIACTPPEAGAPAADAAPDAAAPEAAIDYGPYTNSWDSDAFSRFTHTLHAHEPGDYHLILTARTNSPGGETVAVYPIGPDGTPTTARILFVVAATTPQTRLEVVTIPAGGLPVAVTVENASGRRLSGEYSIEITP